MSDILKEVQDFLEDMHIVDAYETVRRSQELHEKVQAARAQGGQGVAPVAIDRKAFWQKLQSFVDDYVSGYEFRGEGDYTPNEKEQFLIEDCVAGLLHELSQEGYFYTHPQPAQQGSVPEGWRECLTEMVQAMHDYEMSVDEDAPYKHRAMMDRAHALLSATPQPQGDGCEWHSDDNGCWMSQCGKEWYFEDGGPEDNGMNYCVKCGKQCIEIGSSEDGGEGYDNAM